MAPVSVRHHLDLLQGENLICVERVRRKGQVGRPQQILWLNERCRGAFSEQLCLLGRESGAPDQGRLYRRNRCKGHFIRLPAKSLAS